MNDGALDRRGRLLTLVTAFLGWMFAGVIMALVNLAGRAATRSFGILDETDAAEWFSRYVSAFLLGAAAGGLLFGWLGDRAGRVRAMGLSVILYSAMIGLAYFSRGPYAYLGMLFLSSLGVGGMWPNGVALVSEAWPNVSRPLLAGLIGTSANLGLALLGYLASQIEITPESWRWVLLVGAAPAGLGLLILAAVPESPRWLAARAARAGRPSSPVREVFRPPLLRSTLLGISLGAIPLLGNWGAANWVVPWADHVGGSLDPLLKGWAQTARSLGGALGSLLGGWLASVLGRRTTYFLVSLASLAASEVLFGLLTPRDGLFLPLVFTLGFFGTVFFGWLPLYLPELFPTHVRATGSGVSFNFGRVITAFGVLGTGRLMKAFGGDYAAAAQVTSLVYVLGMIVILFAPDTSRREV
jgi:MFS family permease